jgi:membrane protein DedA with SNARE-associated domain/rhodanese-related sulfurtransferase
MAYLLLFASAFGAQAALFVPIVPLLVSSGALAGQGRLEFGWAIAAVAAGVAAGDFLWYRIGRRQGGRVLARICRVALEPATCVRRTENLFGRYGARSLLVAKFVPGMSTVALPLAGVFGMHPRRFVLYDSAGVLLWTSAYVLLGYVAAAPLVAIGSRTGLLQTAPLTIVVLGALIAYVAWKYARRRYLLRQLRISRITVAELKRRLQAGDPLVVVDLRHPIDVEREPCTIPGAMYIPAETLAERHREIPRHREIVLFCTCPDEITSAKEALRLRARGMRRVRPLEGGLTAWREAGYPVRSMGPAVTPEQRILNAA